MSSSDEPLTWREDGLPVSRLYGDVYFSSDDGLAETQAVFLGGCGLPDAWAGRSRFVVAELGFGSGLNIAALLDLWSRTRPSGGRLHIFSIEAHPLAADDAVRALSRWPQIGAAAQALIDAWPGRAQGFHRLELPAFDAVLDLAVMDAAEALERWDGLADAWFLDGFSPALNPAMWSDQVLAQVAARSAPGARVATFTVAGQVRRGLAAAGFTVEKKPGFGRKRERLEARLGGAPSLQAPAPSVAVIGAGIAGASVARAVRALGGRATVFASPGAGPAASGNRAALVTPRFDVGGGPAARLYAQAFARAVALYGQVPGAVIAQGVLQLEGRERDAARFDALAQSPLFEAGDLLRLSPDQAAQRLGEASALGGLFLPRALVVDPAAVLAAWAQDSVQEEVAALEPVAGGWRLSGPGGADLAVVDAVVVAAGAATPRLIDGLTLQPVRGQTSTVEGAAAPIPLAYGGYVVPTRSGLLFGATHDRGDADDACRPNDDARNLAQLSARLPQLAERLATEKIEGRAAVRMATPDRLPLAGAVTGAAPGLYVLGGLGGRGFCTAPLLAEHLAATICVAPSPLPVDLASSVDLSRGTICASPDLSH